LGVRISHHPIHSAAYPRVVEGFVGSEEKGGFDSPRRLKIVANLQQNFLFIPIVHFSKISNDVSLLRRMTL